MEQWTQEEIKILKDNYKNKSKKELIILLDNRTWKGIKNKAYRLKLTWPTAEQRFWKYVNRKQNNRCWNWTGTYDDKGYGRIGINRKLIIAHRFSWVLHNGDIPSGMCVLHTCDNPPCVNPSHLFLGTHQDNSDDKIKKKRQGHKLILNQVKKIRLLCHEGKFSQRKIAKMFHVSQALISDIYRNKIWIGI